MINSFVYLKVFVREGWVNRETGKKGWSKAAIQPVYIITGGDGEFCQKAHYKIKY